MHRRFGMTILSAICGIVLLLLIAHQCIAEEPSALDKAKDAILNLQHIKYSFRSSTVSALEGEVVNFISEGVKTKISYRSLMGKEPNHRSKIFKGLSSNVSFREDAYNGEFFQHYSISVVKSQKNGFFSFSRSIDDDYTTIGPCKNPIEACYDWVSFNRPLGYRWKHLKDPEVWAELKPKRTTKLSENGLTIQRLVFELKHGRDMTVDLVEEYNYFPVKTSIGSDLDPEGQTTLTEASKFVKVEDRHFPTIVEDYYQTSPTSKMQKNQYEIIAKSFSLQPSSDANEINIVPMLGDEVVDQDNNEASQFGMPGTTEKF